MITLATAPGSTRPNEDWAGAAGDVVAVLDGLSAPQGTVSCDHGTPWFVSRLGVALLYHASEPARPLVSALEQAITDVAAQHAETCDLSTQGTPSSTVALARSTPEIVEALVLADSPIVVDADGDAPEVLTDTRVDTLVLNEREAALAAPAGPERERRLAELVEAQRPLRNRAEGYWVAQADPASAHHALTRSWPRSAVRRLAVLTDGASRLVEVFGQASWSQLLNLLDDDGPDALIAATRSAEAHDPAAQVWPRYKASDDAAAIYWRLT